jgi:hypothetical protein
MRIEDAGTLNTGRLTLDEIQKTYLDNWVVLVNLAKQSNPHDVLGGEVYFVCKDSELAEDAMVKAHIDGYSETLIEYFGENEKLKAAIL